MKHLLIIVVLCLGNNYFSQTDSSALWNFSTFTELYYSYDFGKPENHQKADFLFNHKRHNEINLNLLMAKAAYSKDRLRANFGLQFGNYVQYNLSAEPLWAQYIYEANVGFKLFNKKKVWLDAGIFPSHIGFESIIGSDCWTLTRSILAENSPFYEAGIKLSTKGKNDKLEFSSFYLNGWQRIQRPDHFHNPCGGVQLNYKPTSSLTFNYSNFIGSDKPDSLNSIRTFHNFYASIDPDKKIGLILGFDIGTDKYDSANYSFWCSPVLITKFKFNERSTIALRGEYYYDPKQVYIFTGTENGFKTFGTSLNYDLKLYEGLLWRIEGKMYYSEDKIFHNQMNENYCITTALTLKI